MENVNLVQALQNCTKMKTRKIGWPMAVENYFKGGFEQLKLFYHGTYILTPPLFFSFSITVDIQYYISVRCIIYWLHIYVTYEVIPPISLVAP